MNTCPMVLTVPWLSGGFRKCNTTTDDVFKERNERDTQRLLHVHVVLNSSAKPKAEGFPCALAPPCAVLAFGHAGKHANYKMWYRQGFLGCTMD